MKSGTSDVGSSEHHLKELAAALGSGLVTRGHTLVVVDDNFDADKHEFDGGDGGGGDNAGEVRDGAPSEAVPLCYNPDTKIEGKGRLVNDFMTEAGCDRLFYGWQCGWLC